MRTHDDVVQLIKDFLSKTELRITSYDEYDGEDSYAGTKYNIESTNENNYIVIDISELE